MRVHVNSEILKKAVASASRFLATKTPLPAYECIKLTASSSGKFLSLRTINASYSIGVATITCEPIGGLEDEVSAWVMGDVFQDAVRLSEGDVVLEIGDKIKLKYHGGEVILNTVMQEIIPDDPDFNGEQIYSGGADFLHEAFASAGACGLDCGVITDASTDELVVWGCRSNSWVSIHKLGPRSTPDPIHPITFSSSTAGILASGCVGKDAQLLASHNRIRVVGTTDDGLQVTTEVGQEVCKTFSVAPLRKFSFSKPVLVNFVCDLVSALKRVSTVKEAESMCCDIHNTGGILNFSLETSTGSAKSECQAGTSDSSWNEEQDGWLVRVNAERTGSLLRCMNQKESVSIELCNRADAPVAMRLVQGDIELLLALTERDSQSS